ncbi:hypothetical protein N0V88_001574 [Collariella sp. IMI 366227]|nr:hypothetical protein N0V88_001574 [Collariella sp. IMI 366227]
MRTPSFSLLSSVLLLIGGAVAGCQGKPTQCQPLDASIVAHSGKPVGQEVKHNDITLYITKPDKHNARAKARAGTAVLYLSDVFGLALPENKLLADSYARAGYLTVAPDMFQGKPAPGDINVPGFNTTEFLSRHEPGVTDPIIASTIAYMREHLGVTRIAAPGYCFGGRYSFRFAAPGGGIDLAYAAHPSLLEEQEIVAIKKPVSVAAADNDNLFPAEARFAAEQVLVKGDQQYQVMLYSGTEHGFGVRVDVKDKEQKYAKEEAFLQAVRWFDHFFVEA